MIPEEGCVATVTNARIAAHEGTEYVTFQLVWMLGPDMDKCTPALTRGWVRFQGRWYSQSGKHMPTFLVHMTTIENALHIIRQGCVNAGPGINGIGIYAFAMEDESEIFEVMHRAGVGGYNQGAAVVMRPRGMLIKGENCKDGIVPDGCVAYKRDQFAASPSAAEYVSVTFMLEGLPVPKSTIDRLPLPKSTIDRILILLVPSAEACREEMAARHF